MSTLTLRDQDRFIDKFVVGDEDQCWIWEAYRQPKGYGIFRVGDGTQLAHRLSYEHFVGPIPEDHQLHHVCANKGCVNPGHLETVTSGEHGVRHAGRTHCVNGHPYTPENKVWIKSGSYYCRTCRRIRGN